jgi:hypothetical protein
MSNNAYYNDLMARMEELFFHELSDCAGWKTEFIGIDFIQSKNIDASNRESVIESCIREMTGAGLIQEASYAIAGEDILLCLKVKGCIHIGKEVRLKERGIKVYNCVIANMINDQLIEKLGYETTYVADINVDEKSGQCQIRVAIYADKDKIGAVSDWSEECRMIDEQNKWVTIRS